MSGEHYNYDLGNKTGWKLKTPGTSFNLDTGELNMGDANMTYRDKEGNEITKEQFNELRIKGLEEKVIDLEQHIDSLQIQINNISVNLSDR